MAALPRHAEIARGVTVSVAALTIHVRLSMRPTSRADVPGTSVASTNGDHVASRNIRRNKPLAPASRRVKVWARPGLVSAMTSLARERRSWTSDVSSDLSRVASAKSEFCASGGEKIFDTSYVFADPGASIDIS